MSCTPNHYHIGLIAPSRAERHPRKRHPLGPHPPLKPSYFERVMQTLTARDEAARRDTALWKSKYDAMEKIHGKTVLGKLIALDELAKLKRERELLQDQVARAENDRCRLIERTEEDRKRMMDRFKEDKKTRRERESGSAELQEK